MKPSSVAVLVFPVLIASSVASAEEETRGPSTSMASERAPSDGATSDEATDISSAEARLAAALSRKVERSNAMRETSSTELPVAGSQQRAAAFRWSAGAGGFAVLLLLAAMWFKKTREARLVASTGVGLTIQESVWVGKGQRLIVVNAGGQRYLLGATTAGLETLAELGPAPDEQRASSPEEEPELPATFKEFVSQAMNADGSPRRKRREILDGLRAL